AQAAQETAGKVGYPQVKTKKRGLGSFRLTGATVVFPEAIQLPRLGRLYRMTAHERQHTVQQLTTALAQTTSVVVIEDLSVAGLRKHHHLAQASADVGCLAFKRQLTYKAAWYGARVVLPGGAPGWCSQSALRRRARPASGCGWVDADLRLADRTFR